jgi:hypothetical protein
MIDHSTIYVIVCGTIYVIERGTIYVIKRDTINVIDRGTIYDRSWYYLSYGMWYDHVIDCDMINVRLFFFFFL